MYKKKYKWGKIVCIRHTYEAPVQLKGFVCVVTLHSHQVEHTVHRVVGANHAHIPDNTTRMQWEMISAYMFL